MKPLRREGSLEETLEAGGTAGRRKQDIEKQETRQSCKKVALGLSRKSLVFVIALGFSSTSMRTIRNIDKALLMSSL
jgi:hypothetical protein